MRERQFPTTFVKHLINQCATLMMPKVPIFTITPDINAEA